MLLILEPMSLTVFESVIGKDKLGPMSLEVFKYEDYLGPRHQTDWACNKVEVMKWG